MNIYSPWPVKGKVMKFVFRKSWHIRCAYMVDSNVPGQKKESWQWWARDKTFKATWGRWPFISFRFGEYGFYIGWKPINLMDENFSVPPAMRTRSACEFSVRWSNSRNAETDNG